jgi:hypothetical protein
VICPTNTTADETTLTNALGGTYKAVWATPGKYRICNQISMAAYVTFQGSGSGGSVNTISGVAVDTQPPVTLYCPTAGSWSTNLQAFLATQDGDVIRGIAIYGIGNIGGAKNINCVNIVDAVSVTVMEGVFQNCYNGVYEIGDNVTGHSVAYSAGTVTHHNFFQQNKNYGYYATFASSGFASDQIIQNNNFECNTNGQLYMHGGTFSGGHISGNTIQDNCTANTPAIDLAQGFFVIADNIFDKTACCLITGVNHIVVSGNRGNCCLTNSGDPGWMVDLAGTVADINITGNWFRGNANIGAYKAESGAVVGGRIADVTTVGSSKFTSGGFFDANSETTLCPITVFTPTQFAPTTLTDASPITGWDACPIGYNSSASSTITGGQGFNTAVTVAGSNHALSAPTNPIPGTTLTIRMTNSGGVTGFTMPTGNGWQFSGGVQPTWSTTNGQIDHASCQVIDTSHFTCTQALNVQ